MKNDKVLGFFKATSTMRQLSVRPKDKVVKKRMVCLMYELKCEDCEALYVGEPGRSFKARFHKH